MNPATRQIHYVETQALRELILRAKMRKVIEAGFRVTPSRGDVVRVSVVQRRVADVMGREVSPMFRRQVVEAARWAGWRAIVTRATIRYFRFMVAA